jgi:hypothetical protein
VATVWDSLNANAYATGTDALGAGGWVKRPTLITLSRELF